MGAKSIQNIRAAIAFAARSTDRERLGQALPEAEAIVALLAKVPGTKRVEYAGSLRRGRETIGDIDILAAASKPEELSEAFRTMQGVERVLAAGETKSSVRLARGIQVDLRIIEEDAFGAALLYFTGSKQHNVVLRERAIRQSMRLNEYGLFPDDGEAEPPQKRGVMPAAARTEADIYRALDLPWIPPEMREDRGEFRPLPPTRPPDPPAPPPPSSPRPSNWATSGPICTLTRWPPTAGSPSRRLRKRRRPGATTRSR